MKITRKSPISGKTHTLEIPITSQDLFDYEFGKNRGKLIQNVFPHLSAGEREFIMTGITDAEWQELFKEEE